MSLKYTVVLVWVICLSFKVVLTGCEVSLVNRNVTDSFRVGEDGCTNDAKVCTDFDATCHQSDGLCLCTGNEPNFRKPTSKDYGCLSSDSIRAGIAGGNLNCAFRPFQLIPYSHQDPATPFSDTNVVLTSCILTKALVKFPNNSNYIHQPWLNESYVDLRVSNEKLDFKWKRSVPALQGTIITLSLFCIVGSSSSTTKCLRAKILGTWPADAVSVPTKPTVTSTKQSKDTKTKPSQIATKTTSPVTATKITTAVPKSTASARSDDDCSNSNVSNKIFIALFSTSLVVIVVLGIIVGFLWKDRKRMQDKNLKMKNIDEQRRATTGDDSSAYDEVVTKSGIRNEGVYDESFPSSRYNNNEHLSGHKYEEPSNYEPLKRNPLQDQSDEHNYQSLTTSQKGK